MKILRLAHIPNTVFSESEWIMNNFSPEERSILKGYGAWMDALAKGLILPETAEQKRFVEFCKGAADPINQFELIWSKLLKLRKMEEKHRANEEARRVKQKEEARKRNKDNWSPDEIAKNAILLGGDTIRGYENRPYDLVLCRANNYSFKQPCASSCLCSLD